MLQPLLSEYAICSPQRSPSIATAKTGMVTQRFAIIFKDSSSSIQELLVVDPRVE
jgi:hypothetical protein